MEKLSFIARNGSNVFGYIVRQFPKGFIVYAQERIAIVSNDFKEIESIDLMDKIQSYLK